MMLHLYCHYKLDCSVVRDHNGCIPRSPLISVFQYSLPQVYVPIVPHTTLKFYKCITCTLSLCAWCSNIKGICQVVHELLPENSSLVLAPWWRQLYLKVVKFYAEHTPDHYAAEYQIKRLSVKLFTKYCLKTVFHFWPPGGNNCSWRQSIFMFDLYLITM